MFDPTKPVQLRDGRDAGIYMADCGSPEYPIHGWYQVRDGLRAMIIRAHDGKYIHGDSEESNLDLVNVPTYQRKTVPVEVYRLGDANIPDWVNTARTSSIEGDSPFTYLVKDNGHVAFYTQTQFDTRYEEV